MFRVRVRVRVRVCVCVTLLWDGSGCVCGFLTFNKLLLGIVAAANVIIQFGGSLIFTLLFSEANLFSHLSASFVVLITLCIRKIALLSLVSFCYLIILRVITIVKMKHEHVL